MVCNCFWFACKVKVKYFAGESVRQWLNLILVVSGKTGCLYRYLTKKRLKSREFCFFLIKGVSVRVMLFTGFVDINDLCQSQKSQKETVSAHSKFQQFVLTSLMWKIGLMHIQLQVKRHSQVSYTQRSACILFNCVVLVHLSIQCV